MKIPIVYEYKKADLPVKAVIGFTIGFIIAPLSYSVYWFLGFLILSEIFWTVKSGFNFNTRSVMILASVLGWVLGRLIVNYDPITEMTSIF